MNGVYPVIVFFFFFGVKIMVSNVVKHIMMFI